MIALIGDELLAIAYPVILLEYIEDGSSYEEIIDAFPSITLDDIKAAIRYAKEVVDGTYFDNYTIAEIPS